MSRTAIYMTEFKVRALRCIGGQTDAVPHHLATRKSAGLGTLGAVMPPAGRVPVVRLTPRPRTPRRSAKILSFYRGTS
jgi:hypothetical protein